MTTHPGPVRVLLVEDSTAQARFLQQVLSGIGEPGWLEVKWVECLDSALEWLARMGADLVLLDLVLPDSAGIDTFTAIQAAQADGPIIVLSGAGDETTALRAVAEGAQDYLAKATMSPEVLSRSIQYAIERYRTLVEFQRLAMLDELTGVNNRRGFLAAAEKQLARARLTSSHVIVMFLDIDSLKVINDTYGHRQGDRALIDLADVMRSTFRGRDVVGRIGGDEFCALIVIEREDPGAADAAVARLGASLDTLISSTCRPFILSYSVGAISRAAYGTTLSDLLATADKAMYERRQTA